MKERRVQKVNKILKEYLMHKQNSVFIGQLRKSEFLEIKKRIDSVVKKEEDYVCVWAFKNKNEVLEIDLGVQDEDDGMFF